MMKTPWKFALAAVAAAALLTSSPGSASSTPEGGKVRIGLAAPAASLLVPKFALEHGLFAEQGLDDVEVSFIPGPQLVPATAGGQVEIAIVSAPQADLIAINGQLLTIVGAWALSPGQYLIVGPGIDSVEDLKGKRVGINGSKGSSSSMLMSYALSSVGLSFDDVDLNVLQDATSQVQAYAAGQIEAMVTFPPNINMMLTRVPGSKVIEEYEDVFFPGAQTVFNTAWLDSNPGDGMAAVRALDNAVRLWRERPEEAKALISKELNREPGDPVIGELYEYTLKLFADGLVPITAEMEKSLFEQLRANGFPVAVDELAETVIRPDFIEQALRN